jgi:uncharacterized protein YndB with AHSA1/START domain
VALRYSLPVFSDLCLTIAFMGPAIGVASAQTDLSTTVIRTADAEVIVRRRFAAPPAKVFEGLTSPALLRKWMSANGRELIDVRADLRPGGTYRYVFRGPGGRTFGMYGTHREFVSPRRIVHTEAYEGYDWDPLVTTTDLSEEAGGTALLMTIRYPSKEICDKDFDSVQSGSAAGFSRLEKLLAK